MLWAGDFNRHHPLWDNDEDDRLFTPQALADAEHLISLTSDLDMCMTLPKGIPTLKHMVTKNISRPDNVFCSNNFRNMVVRCDVDASLQPPKTDHFPIVTSIEIPQERISVQPSCNFRDVDWEEFNKDLSHHLAILPPPHIISSEGEFQETVSKLTETIQKSICTVVPENKPHPYSKRWWTKDLAKMKKSVNRLNASAFKYRAIREHPIHEDLRQAKKNYANAITKAKVDHWKEFLENAGESQVWTANGYINNPIGDGGKARIPTLKVTGTDSLAREINTNEGKAEALARTFFPPRPATSTVPPNYAYPRQLPNPPPFTTQRIYYHIQKTSPHKAPGPDGIPNIVLQKAANLLVPHLFFIYRAVFDLKTYHQGWQEFTTCVLRKPGKARYDIPKSYRPIALLCTMAKVLTSMVAEDLSHLAETLQLIPPTHFGGRPGRTTTDAIHLLVHQVKEAWRKGKVVSILFLDIEGAFPNAVTDRLLHNMRKRSVPESIVCFMEKLLTGRSTQLKFDDYTSEPIPIDNGVGQGDPVSLGSFIFYNSDLLELLTLLQSLGYVDDIMVMATGKNFVETTAKLRNSMEGEDGGFQWADDHNSKFEISKLAVMHCGWKKTRNREGELVPLHKPMLKLKDKPIQEVEASM
jgi:hypothetical protein